MTFHAIRLDADGFEHTFGFHLGSVLFVEPMINGPQINPVDGRPGVRDVTDADGKPLLDANGNRVREFVPCPGRSVVVRIGEPPTAHLQLTKEAEIVEFACAWVAYRGIVDGEAGTDAALRVFESFPDVLKVIERVVFHVGDGDGDELNDHLCRENEALRAVLMIVQQGEHLPDTKLWAGLYSTARNILARARRMG